MTKKDGKVKCICEKMTKIYSGEKSGKWTCPTHGSVHKLSEISGNCEVMNAKKIEEINQIIRNHFATVFQKDDLMIAIVQAGNESAKAIHEKMTGGKK